MSETLTPDGYNENGVAMCACSPRGAVHAWEPGESCSPERVIPKLAPMPKREEAVQGACKHPDACRWDWWPDHCQCPTDTGRRRDAPDPNEQEEAVEAAQRAVEDRVKAGPIYPAIAAEIAVDAAEPFLRSQIERELGERLLSEEAVRKALLAFTARAEYPSRALGEREVDMREALQAALTTATHEGGAEEREPCGGGGKWHEDGAVTACPGCEDCATHEGEGDD